MSAAPWRASAAAAVLGKADIEKAIEVRETVIQNKVDAMVIRGYFAERVVTLAGASGSAAVANARLRAAEDAVAAACKAHNIYAFIGIPVFHGDVNAGAPRPHLISGRPADAPPRPGPRSPRPHRPRGAAGP